jgi:hypothetical protein
VAGSANYNCYPVVWEIINNPNVTASTNPSNESLSTATAAWVNTLHTNALAGALDEVASLDASLDGVWGAVASSSILGIYAARISQSATNVPVLTELLNTETWTMTAGRDGIGDYKIDTSDVSIFNCVAFISGATITGKSGANIVIWISDKLPLMWVIT